MNALFEGHKVSAVECGRKCRMARDKRDENTAQFHKQYFDRVLNLYNSEIEKRRELQSIYDEAYRSV